LKVTKKKHQLNYRGWVWWMPIALVKESEIHAFKNKVYDEYLKVIGYAPDFYVAHIGSGTTVIG
jgi:galactokinase